MRGPALRRAEPPLLLVLDAVLLPAGDGRTVDVAGAGGEAAGQGGHPGLAEPAPPVHEPDQEQRYDQGEQRGLAADDRGDGRSLRPVEIGVGMAGRPRRHRRARCGAQVRVLRQRDDRDLPVAAGAVLAHHQHGHFRRRARTAPGKRCRSRADAADPAGRARSLGPAADLGLGLAHAGHDGDTARPARTPSTAPV